MSWMDKIFGSGEPEKAKKKKPKPKKDKGKKKTPGQYGKGLADKLKKRKKRYENL